MSEGKDTNTKSREEQQPGARDSPGSVAEGKENVTTANKETVVQTEKQKKDAIQAELFGAESYYGLVETVEDAILVVEACRRSMLPRVKRRLGDRDRALIRSGSVFVFIERESGIRRWTDGKIWSPSRISGEFLLYRQLEQRVSTVKRPLGAQIKLLAGEEEEGEPEPEVEEEETSHKSGAQYKKDGLVKKTISLNIGEETFHLICYFSEAEQGKKHDLAATQPSKHQYFSNLKGARMPAAAPTNRTLTPISQGSMGQPSRTPPPILPSRGMHPHTIGGPFRRPTHYPHGMPPPLGPHPGYAMHPMPTSYPHQNYNSRPPYYAPDARTGHSRVYIPPNIQQSPYPEYQREYIGAARSSIHGHSPYGHHQMPPPPPMPHFDLQRNYAGQYPNATMNLPLPPSVHSPHQSLAPLRKENLEAAQARMNIASLISESPKAAKISKTTADDSMLLRHFAESVNDSGTTKEDYGERLRMR